MRQRYAIICLRMQLHRRASVTHYLLRFAHEYPALATGLLTHALVDPMAEVGLPQCIAFFRTFCLLFKDGLCEPSDVQRLLSSITIAVVEDRPPGLCNALVQTSPDVFQDLIEQLTNHLELPLCKQAVSVICALTVGCKYTDRPQLDGLVTHVNYVTRSGLHATRNCPVLHPSLFGLSLSHRHFRRLSYCVMQTFLRIGTDLLANDFTDNGQSY